jgi:hypothetical protein
MDTVVIETVDLVEEPGLPTTPSTAGVASSSGAQHMPVQPLGLGMSAPLVTLNTDGWHTAYQPPDIAGGDSIGLEGSGDSDSSEGIQAGIGLSAREFLWHWLQLEDKVGRLLGKLPLAKR